MLAPSFSDLKNGCRIGNYVITGAIKESPNVKRAVKKSTGCKYIIKEPRNQKEIKNLTRFNHKNVVGLVEKVLYRGTTLLVLEDAGTSLAKIRRSKPFTDLQLFTIVQGLLRGLRHIHEKGYEHGDLHADNVAVTRSCHATILDLEYVRRESSISSRNGIVDEVCGFRDILAYIFRVGRKTFSSSLLHPCRPHTSKTWLRFLDMVDNVIISRKRPDLENMSRFLADMWPNYTS